MKRTIIPIAALLLSACAKTEEGIDTTVIRGNIIVPPATFDEPGDATNDSWDAPVELPMVTYRETTIQASIGGFGSIEDGIAGTSDYYTVVANGSGVVGFDLLFETSQGMGRDKSILYTFIYDMDNVEEECTTAYSCAPVDDECGCEASYDEVGEHCVEEKDCADVCTWEIVATETCVPVPTVGYTSDGTLGHVAFDLEVVDGGTYGIEIMAADSTEFTEPEDAMPYGFTLGALTPEDDEFIVGAYVSNDVNERGNPVAGASVTDLQWDEAERAWVGKFEMLHVKSVVSEEVDCRDDISYSCVASDCGCAAGYDEDSASCVQDTECEETCTWEVEETVTEICDEEHTVVESIPEVWLMGGTWPTLNASIPSGALYSSEAVHVATGDGDDLVGTWGIDTDAPETEPEESTDTADTAPPDPVTVPRGEIVVVVDALQPKVIGWEYTEEEPNDVLTDEDGAFDWANVGSYANMLPVASGPGIVDIIHGVVIYETEDPDYSGDNDVFGVTVEEEMNATVTFTYGSDADNLDMYLLDSTGGVLVAAYAYGDVNPESFSTATAGFTFVPGEEYYIVIFGWVGTAGEKTYNVELEYAAL